MKYPIYTNLIHIVNGREYISKAVVDIHISEIEYVVKQPDGLTGIEYKAHGFMKLGIPFEDFYDLFSSLFSINEDFKDIVEDYSKDNYANLRQHLNNDDLDDYDDDERERTD